MRRPGKTIILLLLVFILGSAISGAISVTRAVNSADANLRRNMRPIVSIDVDWHSLNEDTIEWMENDDFDWDSFIWEEADVNDSSALPSNFPPQLQNLTASDVRAIGSLDYVDDFTYSILASLKSFDLDQYQGTNEWEFEDGEVRWFDVRGTSNENLLQIDQGDLVLIEGSQFSQDDLIPGKESSVAIVSEAFAHTNNLTIGSMFSLYDFVMYPDEYGNISSWGRTEADVYAQAGMEFEVIGLFDITVAPDAEPGSDPWGFDPRMDQINGIYIPNWVIEDILTRSRIAQISVWESVNMEQPLLIQYFQDDEQEAEVIALFVLNDPADIENFKAAATELLPTSYHYFVDLSSEFDQISSSMEMIQNIAHWVLFASIGATLLVLSLSIILSLQDRRYEMGVYLAQGEKKVKIIIQILLEVISISFVAITLAVFAGNFISSTISKNMLENELISQYQQNLDDAIWGVGEWTAFDRIGITPKSMTLEEMMEAFEVSLTTQTIVLFYVIGLGTVALSTIVPVIYLVRLNPKKILT